MGYNRKKLLTYYDTGIASPAISPNGDSQMDKKIVFVAFAMEDEKCRDYLKMQSLQNRSPFEFIDMSVKEPYPQSVWRDMVRTRIRRSHGVIALISKNSLKSSGQQWEIQCALEERKPIIGISAYPEDRTTLNCITTYSWNWPNIAYFINSL